MSTTETKTDDDDVSLESRDVRFINLLKNQFGETGLSFISYCVLMCLISIVVIIMLTLMILKTTLNQCSSGVSTFIEPIILPKPLILRTNKIN